MEPSPGAHSPEIRVGKTVLAIQEKGKPAELNVFTMTLGTETIQLFPLRNWGQLDVYKWRVQGKLPATPAGLEIANDHVRIAGETVSVNDPHACSKLEKVLNEWLLMERTNAEMAKQKLHAKPPSAVQNDSPQAGPTKSHFQVQVDKGGQVHIHCWQGKEIVASIGLNLPGFQSLFSQGLMVKPRMIKAGVLHDWVELDGVFYSFEKGNNDAGQLEKVLNERYLPAGDSSSGKDILIFANPASSTGFDIQFPVAVGGALNSRKRPLNEESLEILQDPDRCGVLNKGILIRLTRPSLIFKLKTADGGERYLDRCPENTVTVQDETGKGKVIDLSQPVNCLRLSAVELTAVFNHPTIHKHGKASSPVPRPESASTEASPDTVKTQAPQLIIYSPPEESREKDDAVDSKPSLTTGTRDFVAETQPQAAPAEVSTPGPWLLFPQSEAASVSSPPASPPTGDGSPLSKASATLGQQVPAREPEAKSAEPGPNSWLKPILEQPSIRYDWLASLLYERLAEHFGNSREGKLGASGCWAVAISDEPDITAPDFHGLFLTEKRGLGFIKQGRLACFHKGVVVIGTEESAIEGIEVDLEAVGIDTSQRVIFVVHDGFRKKFDVAERLVSEALMRLESDGALILGQTEALESKIPLEVVWTVPEYQESPDNPQAVESTPPESC